MVHEFQKQTETDFITSSIKIETPVLDNEPSTRFSKQFNSIHKESLDNSLMLGDLYLKDPNTPLTEIEMLERNLFNIHRKIDKLPYQQDDTCFNHYQRLKQLACLVAFCGNKTISDNRLQSILSGKSRSALLQIISDKIDTIDTLHQGFKHAKNSKEKIGDIATQVFEEIIQDIQKMKQRTLIFAIFCFVSALATAGYSGFLFIREFIHGLITSGLGSEVAYYLFTHSIDAVKAMKSHDDYDKYKKSLGANFRLYNEYFSIMKGIDALSSGPIDDQTKILYQSIRAATQHCLYADYHTRIKERFFKTQLTIIQAMKKRNNGENIDDEIAIIRNASSKLNKFGYYMTSAIGIVALLFFIGLTGWGIASLIAGIGTVGIICTVLKLAAAMMSIAFNLIATVSIINDVKEMKSKYYDVCDNFLACVPKEEKSSANDQRYQEFPGRFFNFKKETNPPIQKDIHTPNQVVIDKCVFA